MNIALVIGWKFPDQQGMSCKTINGVLEIVKFPGGIPSKADQDAWAAEYTAAGVHLYSETSEELRPTETNGEIARKLEELTLLLDANGIEVPASGKTWAQSRATKRNNVV